MKKWTVVIEITDTPVEGEDYISKQGISDMVMKDVESGITFQIMECIEAPYGPQHPNGVFLDERQKPRPKKIENAPKEVKMQTEADHAKGCTCIRFYDGSPHHKTCSLFKGHP